jgi:hypothetical protein
MGGLQLLKVAKLMSLGLSIGIGIGLETIDGCSLSIICLLSALLLERIVSLA